LYHLSVLPQLQAYIRKHALFRPGDRVGVAVSGGADSVALLRALLELRSELGIVLSVVHLHHGIRGEEADADEAFVTGLAKTYDLPLHLERADVPAHRKAEKLSLEASARELRYTFFKRLLETHACDKIATAHSLDDQAETVLLRMMRGTGTRGLAAIPPLRDASQELAARIVRPLLATRREQIETYLRSLNQPWREDSTNKDPRHLRNRIRHELLPSLEREYNPALRQSLVNLAEIARAEEEHWMAELARLSPLLSEQSDDRITLDRSQYLALSLALQRRLLVDLADRLNLPAGFDDIERIRQIAANPGSEHEFEGGWQVLATKQHLELLKTTGATQPAAYDLPLPIPGTVDLPIPLRLRTTLLPASDAARYNSASLLAYDRLELPLRVRNWQPGDRFCPAGSKQAEKLKRLFQEHRIPASARSSWPVVLSGSSTIVWVRDFPVASGFQAENSNAVLIEALPLDPGETRQD
jgi:tRNA(Ile)-lysidine synthase